MKPKLPKFKFLKSEIIYSRKAGWISDGCCAFKIGIADPGKEANDLMAEKERWFKRDGSENDENADNAFSLVMPGAGKRQKLIETTISCMTTVGVCRILVNPKSKWYLPDGEIGERCEYIGIAEKYAPLLSLGEVKGTDGKSVVSVWQGEERVALVMPCNIDEGLSMIMNIGLKLAAKDVVK